MKNIPNKLYLNFHPDVPQDSDFNDLREVTHSTERIYKGDVLYFLRRSVEVDKPAGGNLEACPECGEGLPDHFNYCAECGIKINWI